MIGHGLDRHGLGRRGLAAIERAVGHLLRAGHAREHADSAEQTGLEARRDLGAARQKDPVQRRRVVDGFQAIDDRAARERHPALIRADVGMGAHALGGHVELERDLIVGAPAAPDLRITALGDPREVDRLAVHAHACRAAPAGNSQAQRKIGGCRGIDADRDRAVPGIVGRLRQRDRGTVDLHAAAALDIEMDGRLAGSDRVDV